MFQLSPRHFLNDFSNPKSSPLAPRDPNACPRFSIQMASARKAGTENSVYSHKRAHNPLFHRKASEAQDHRRQVFLKKVKEGADDRKWESRSEQILRQDFLVRQKQWEIEQARTAPEALPSVEEEEQDVKSGPLQEVEMVDQIFSQEDRGIEELVSLLQHAEDDHEEEFHDHAKSGYGSDEDEYDQLFMEVLLEKGPVGEAVAANPEQNQDHDMDMSLD